MSTPELDVDDVVVLLLGAPTRAKSLKDRIEGVTRLEKLVFLLQHETQLGKQLGVDADFTGHNFGPFSAKIYQAVELLNAAQIIQDSANIAPTDDDAWENDNVIYGESDLSDRYSTRNFSLTERGRRYYQALIKDLPPGTEDALAEFKERFGRLPLRQLIRYVYEKPEYAAFLDKSVIRRDVLGR
jgi:uncharacterized protein